MKKLLTTLLLSSFIFIAFAQIDQLPDRPKATKKFQLEEAAVELQAYPAGLMPGIRGDFYLNRYAEANLRLGLNIADRQDWGEHDKETGSGFGFSLGYRYKIKGSRKGPFIGARVDIWWMTIDWENIGIKGSASSGSTDISILQPTMELGWKFELSDTWMLAPTLSFGQEINIATKGEEVGQGGISLFGFTLGKTF